MDKKVNGLKDDDKITLKNGQVVSGKEIKNAWNSTTLKLTEKEFGPNRGGANGGSIVDVNLRAAQGYLAWGDSGATYLAFHETGHNTPLGVSTGLKDWTAWLKQGGGKDDLLGYSNSAMFGDNERTANDIAQGAAGAVGEPILANPTYGY